MAKGQKFLKVTSILMIIGGALSGITCLLGIAGVALLAAVADSHAAALLLYLALALALAAAVVEFIAGLKGLKACKTGENADKCVILGAVIAGITILSTIINLAGGGKVNVTSILLSLVVPGLYIYGAMQVKKGEWQPQQAQAVPQQPYQQAPQYQQTPPQQDQPRRTSERPAFQNPIPRPSSLSRTRRIPPRLSSRSSRYSRSRPLPRLRSALPAAPKPAARASVRTAAQPCAKVPLPYGKRTDTQTTL